MICGNCKLPHGSVVEVRACYEGWRNPPTPLLAPATVAQAETRWEQPAFPALADPEPRPSSTHEPEPRSAVGPITGRVEAATEGFYSLKGKVYKVQRAIHGSGHLYAKVLIPPNRNAGETKAHWAMASGFYKMLTPAMRLQREEAVKFGKLYGVCCICGRTLTNEESIEAGIGPVCAGKAGW